MGNWSAVTTDSTTQSRTHNQQNQMTSISEAITPEYDRNGNLTTDPTNGNTYVYDAWNRLVAVKNGGNTLTAYTYDGLNRRLTESVSGAQRDLYYNAQWQVIEERVNGQTQTQYVWDPLASDTLVERDRDPNGSGTLSERLYAQQEANGNVTALVDTTGNVVERFVYDPYGQVTVLAPDWSGPVSDAYGWLYLYQGGRYDPTSGLYNFRNRDYSPTLGRWLRQDPIGFIGGDDNLYRFERNKPTDLTDPLGLVPTPKLKAGATSGTYGPKVSTSFTSAGTEVRLHRKYTFTATNTSLEVTNETTGEYSWLVGQSLSGWNALFGGDNYYWFTKEPANRTRTYTVSCICTDVKADKWIINFGQTGGDGPTVKNGYTSAGIGVSWSYRKDTVVEVHAEWASTIDFDNGTITASAKGEKGGVELGVSIQIPNKTTLQDTWARDWTWVCE
jgi:RHS repeat-associated protein